MISVRPITSRIATHLFRASLARAAETVVELSAAASSPVDPPIMLPDAPLRIRGHQWNSPPALNMERLTRRLWESGPTRMHLLRDVIIADGTLLSRSYFDRIAPAKRKLLARGDPDEIGEAVLCSTWFTASYFGHWLREGLALEQLATDRGLMPLVFDSTPWPHEPGYRSLTALEPRRTRLARCDRLWVIDEPRYNDHFAKRYGRVRDRLRSAVGAPARASKRIFLSRGSLCNGRVLANEDEVRTALGRRGFAILSPECMEPPELARALSGARLVVAAEGSALAHAAIAMPRGAGLLTILGAQHFNMNYKAIADALGFRFGLTIADPLDKDRFSQPLDRLNHAIDLLDAAVDNRRRGSVPARRTRPRIRA